MIIILVVLLWAFPAPAQQLYEWIDERGQHNFTDNLNNVPERYRSQATVSPSLKATPEMLQRDAERRHQDYLGAVQSAWQRKAQEIRRLNAQDAAAAEAEFNRVAAFCAPSARVDSILKPDQKVTVYGSSRERFAFDKCMANSGQPVEKAPIRIKIER